MSAAKWGGALSTLYGLTMKVLTPLILAVLAIAPNAARGQQVVYYGPVYTIADYFQHNCPDTDSPPAPGMFREEGTGNWRTQDFECPPSIGNRTKLTKSEQTPVAYSPLGQTPAAKIQLSPGKRFTALNRD